MLRAAAYQYQFYEMAHAALAPARAVSDAAYFLFRNPFNPFSATTFGKNIAAGAELFERMTRRYGKPVFGLKSTVVDGVAHDVREEIVWSRPFASLLHFVRPTLPGPQPKLLIVAPMSGHYATLLRGTVEAFLPTHEVYITDWADARAVPLALGHFDLDDYIDYLQAKCWSISVPGVHTLGVCQPAVPLIMTVALMEAEKNPCAPASMTLMGGPIDTRRSPTAVNQLAEQRGVEWFRDQLPADRSVPLSRRRARRLSRLSAIVGLHGDEPRPPRQRPCRHVQPSGLGRRRFRGKTSRVL